MPAIVQRAARLSVPLREIDRLRSSCDWPLSPNRDVAVGIREWPLDVVSGSSAQIGVIRLPRGERQTDPRAMGSAHEKRRPRHWSVLRGADRIGFDRTAAT